jgi:hypothetical protein
VGLLLIVVAILVSGCVSSEPNGDGGRAAIVIQHADGNTSDACVTFEGDEIDGEELLNLSRIPYVADFGNSMGSILCSIEGKGCDFPGEKCFCQCSQPGSCAYWAYFVKNEDGDWVYAPIGARLRKVVDGDLDAWVWIETGGFGQVQGSSKVPDVNFAEICAQ